MSMCFHLAFPVHDFDKAKKFYHDQLGFELGRQSTHALIFNCAGNQIVAHLVDEPVKEQKSIYPRHFGLIFSKKEAFDQFLKRLKDKQVQFAIALKTRYEGTRIEHQSFFLKDPSNNLLEFKHYTYESAIFGEANFKQVGETR